MKLELINEGNLVFTSKYIIYGFFWDVEAWIPYFVYSILTADNVLKAIKNIKNEEVFYFKAFWKSRDITKEEFFNLNIYPYDVSIENFINSFEEENVVNLTETILQ